MISAIRAQAESHFTAIETRQKKALSGQEQAAHAMSENTSRLKNLRLAKEAKDRADLPNTKLGKTGRRKTVLKTR